MPLTLCEWAIKNDRMCDIWCFSWLMYSVHTVSFDITHWCVCPPSHPVLSWLGGTCSTLWCGPQNSTLWPITRVGRGMGRGWWSTAVLALASSMPKPWWTWPIPPHGNTSQKRSSVSSGMTPSSQGTVYNLLMDSSLSPHRMLTYMACPRWSGVNFMRSIDTCLLMVGKKPAYCS